MHTTAEDRDDTPPSVRHEPEIADRPHIHVDIADMEKLRCHDVHRPVKQKVKKSLLRMKTMPSSDSPPLDGEGLGG